MFIWGLIGTFNSSTLFGTGLERWMFARLLPLFFLLVLSNAEGSSLSLVANHDFEDYDSCPTASSQLHQVPGWAQPTLPTSDYFNACNTTSVGVPLNGLGNQAAHSGSAYGGFLVRGVDGPPSGWFEYLQSPLLTQLEPKEYRLTFQISLAENSGFAIKEIGAFLGPQLTRLDTAPGYINDGPLLVTAQVETPPTNFIEDNNWVTVSQTFIATGNETHITIGFFKEIDTDPLSPGFNYRQVNFDMGVKQYAYYYVDNVILEPVEPDVYTIAAGPGAAGFPLDTLVAVNTKSIDSSNFCSTTAIGLTDDSSGQNVFGIRGLAFANEVLYGVAGDGFLYSIDPTSAETIQVSSPPFAVPNSNGLTFLESFNTLYFASETEQQLHSYYLNNLNAGSSVSNITDDILGVAVYPSTAAGVQPTPPLSGPTIYSILDDDIAMSGNEHIAVFDAANNTIIPPPHLGDTPLGPEAITFHPDTGELFVLHDDGLVSDEAYLSTFDSGSNTLVCKLPFDSIPIRGGGGLTFGPPRPKEALHELHEYCVEGTSDGVGWSWSVDDGTTITSAQIAGLPIGSTPMDFVEAFIASLQTEGIIASISEPNLHNSDFDRLCFQLAGPAGTQLFVDDFSTAPPAMNLVDNLIVGVDFNPTIYEASILTPIAFGGDLPAPEESLVSGTAIGGAIEFDIAGETISVTTTSGQSNAMIATNLEVSINANTILTGLGVSVFSSGDSIFVDATLSNITITDAGLSFGSTVTTPVSSAAFVSTTMLAFLSFFLILFGVWFCQNRSRDHP